MEKISTIKLRCYLTTFSVPCPQGSNSITSLDNQNAKNYTFNMDKVNLLEDTFDFVQTLKK